MSRIITKQGFYTIKAANTVERITDDDKLEFNKLWIYPGKPAATNPGLLTVNAAVVYVGEQGTGDKMTPDPLEPGAAANEILPIKFELPEGRTKRLSDILIRGGAGDGVFFKYWEA